MTDLESPWCMARVWHGQAAAGQPLPRIPVPLTIPSAVDPPVRERVRLYRSRCSARRTNDLERHSLVCWARPGSMADGMIRSTSATYGRWLAYSSLAIIPESERPAGGTANRP